MRKASILLIVFTLCTIQIKAQFTQKNLEVKFAPKSHATAKEIGSITYENLRIYPVLAKKSFEEINRDIGKFTPLEDALKSKKILITEHVRKQEGSNNGGNLEERLAEPDSGHIIIEQRQRINNRIEQQTIGGGETVNTLYIENTSEDTIFLMSGEVVKGGKQDRVIAKDMVIPPNSGQIDLSVFCVEKGRWTYKDSDSFNGYFQMASMNVRGAVDKSKEQTKVWEEVDKVNSKQKVKTSTSAYTALTSSKEFKEKQDNYLKEIKEQLKNQQIIGMIAVTGNRVIGCDMFASNELFSLYADKLLQSYITEAISNGEKVTINKNKVEKYVNDLLANEEKQSEFIEKGGKGKRFKHGKKTLHITSY